MNAELRVENLELRKEGKMYEIECVFKGVVPMMWDRYVNPEEAAIGQQKRKGKKVTEAELRKETEAKLYKDRKGVYCPADNIRMMLIGNASRRGASIILGSEKEKNKGTMYKSICTGCIWVMGPTDPMKVYIEPKRTTFDDIDVRSANSTAGRGPAKKIIKKRPIITVPWSLAFTIQVTDDQIDQTFCRQLFEIAGLRCGVGAYGPTFGRCLIDKWKVQK